jgi:serine/threonine-protein phosphatase PGAM5
MAQKIILLVRHAEALKGEKFGPLGGPLSPRGRRQAKRLAKALKRYRVDAVHSSDQPRARETAEILARALRVRPVRIHRMLREGYPARVPGARYKSDEKKAIREHGKRAERAFRKFFSPSKKSRCDVVVSHGNLIRWLALRALDVRTDRWVRLGITHTGLTTVVVGPKGERCLFGFNDSGHLPKGLRTKG